MQFLPISVSSCRGIRLSLVHGPQLGAGEGNDDAERAPRVAEYRRARPRKVESRAEVNLARSSKEPGLVYLQALDAAGAERGLRRSRQRVACAVVIVSLLPVFPSPSHTFNRPFRALTRYPTRTCPTLRAHLCLY